jgi:hypothetical protein
MGLAALSSRVGLGDCVVLMSEAADTPKGLVWPFGVRVFVLASDEVSVSAGDVIGYRELVALTAARSSILSW